MLICLQEMLDGLIGYNMDYHFKSSIYVLRPWRIFFRLWIIVNYKSSAIELVKNVTPVSTFSSAICLRYLNLIIIGKIKQMKFNSSNALIVTGT